MAEMVTVRRYIDVVEAQLARAKLGACGIRAFVVDGASFNPILSGAIGAVRLDVSESDLEQAEEVLAAEGADPDDPDEPAETASYRTHGAALAAGRDAEVVRCPRCELEYCFFERPRFAGGPGGVTGLAVLLYPLVLLSPKRWRCHKCEHVWDDPKDGPREMTRLEQDDPHPVFRLRRRNHGMGLFLGAIAGGVGGLVLNAAHSWAGGLVFVLVAAFGYLMGGALGDDVCSKPGCRAPLPAAAEECPRCKGTIAGNVRRAAEHFSAAADARRAIAAHRQEPPALEEPRRPKKKARRPRQAPSAAS
jgi:hypothetical protein